MIFKNFVEKELTSREEKKRTISTIWKPVEISRWQKEYVIIFMRFVNMDHYD